MTITLSDTELRLLTAALGVALGYLLAKIGDALNDARWKRIRDEAIPTRPWWEEGL